jgi:hypothetical protein
MTTPYDPTVEPAPQVRPRAAWYLLVAVLWIASLVVGGTVIATVYHVVDDGVTSIQASGQMHVPSSGRTIYSHDNPDSPACTVTDIASGRQTPLDELGFDLSATINGRTVYAVASTPDGLAAGDYTVSCQGLTDSQLYYGDKFPLGSVAIRVGISALLGVAGLALLIVLLVRRHLSKSRIRTGQLLASTPMGGPFQAYQPPPGQQYSPTPPQQYSPASPQQYPPAPQQGYPGQYPPAPPPGSSAPYPPPPAQNYPPPTPPDDSGR